MRIEVLTSLYPGPPRPFEGIFAERRWLGMGARGHEVRVTQPMPRTPGPLSRGAWAEIRRMPRMEVRDGIQVDRPRYLHLPGRARRNACRFARVGLRRILTACPDVVVCDYAWPAAEAAPILRRAGIPCVISGRGSDVLEVAGEAGLGAELATCLQAAGHWCAVSQDLVDAMDDLGGAPGRGVLVPNGVDLSRFSLRDRAEARASLSLPSSSDPIVLVVGHLIARKDPLLALAAFVNGAPDVAACYFLGRGPLEQELRERARELGVSHRVHFVGEVSPDELSQWYASANLLLLTSRREGRPNVVLEALASGVPALATSAGGTAELLSNWSERSLAPDRDANEIGRMLRDLLADPPARVALRASVEHLSWESSLETLEACLDAAVDGAVDGRSERSA